MIKTEEKEYPVMVTIRCVTYNHVKYIRKCLEGFVMQKTTFPFEAIVHDDASTDGTTDIIREYADKYPTIIKPLFEVENQWSKHNDSIGRIMDANTRGKYIAPCDGDDYWKDPFKLQKQVDFLEEHPDFTLVHTGFNYINMEGLSIPVPDEPLYKDLKKRIRNGYVWHRLLVHSSFMLYSTVLMRASVFEKEKMGVDHGIFMSCARQGRIQYLPEETTSYRIDNNSFMRTGKDIIVNYIQNAIFEQLCFYSSYGFKTMPYYRYNLISRVYIAEGFLSTMAHLSEIEVKKKYYIYTRALLLRPFTLAVLPIALVKKIIRRTIKKIAA